MQDLPRDEIAIVLTGAAGAAPGDCRVVDDYACYTKLEKINEHACSDAEDLARLVDKNAVEQGKLATEERRVEATA